MGVETRTGRIHNLNPGAPRIGVPATHDPLTGKEAVVTRESKLALIIGFVLVLVVGVLVSDHFSQVSTMALDTNQPDDGRIAAPITDLGQREQQGINNAIPPSNARYAAIGAPTQASEAQAPVVISNSQRQLQDEQQHLADSTTHGDSIIDRAIEEARRRVQETELPAAAQFQRSVPDQPDQPEPVRALPSPTYPSYTVVKGDSLIKLARRFLNDGERWKEIHQLNADQLGPDAILKIGMTLRLPSDAKANQKKGPIIPTPARPGATGSYTVLPGDTLGQISMRLLGTSKRADEIARLNGLDSVNEIFAGMTLKIPAK